MQTCLLYWKADEISIHFSSYISPDLSESPLYLHRLEVHIRRLGNPRWKTEGSALENPRAGAGRFGEFTHLKGFLSVVSLCLEIPTLVSLVFDSVILPLQLI